MFGFTVVSRVPIGKKGWITTYRAKKLFVVPGHPFGFTHVTVTEGEHRTYVQGKNESSNYIRNTLIVINHPASPMLALEALLGKYPQSAPKEWVECRLADTKKGERVRLTNEDGAVEFTVEGRDDKQAGYRSSRHATYYQHAWPKSEVLRTPSAPVVPTHPGIWMNKDGVPVKFHPSDFPSPGGRRSYLESRAPWVELVPKED